MGDCGRSLGISLREECLFRRRDRHVAALLAMTNWVRVRQFSFEEISLFVDAECQGLRLGQ